MTSTSKTRTTWRTGRVLGDRDAGLYLAAVVVSGLGSSAMWLVAGVWVKDLTGSDALAALSACALWAPLLAGPLLGTLADRLHRRALLITTDLALAALLLTLFTVHTPGDLWLLYTVLLVYGAAGVVHDAAESALVATAVDPSLLGDFNGLRMTANESMKLLAPPVGAGLYAAYGGATVALLDAVTFVAAAGLYGSVRFRKTQPRPSERPTTGLRARTTEGARRLLADRRLRPLVLAGGTTMLLSGVNGALIYAVVESLGHSPAYTGLLHVAQGTGSIAVGLSTGTLLRRLGELRFAAYGIALTGVAVAARTIPNDIVVLTCSAAIGVGLPCVLTAALTAVQRETPPDLLGRTTATAHTLLFAPTAAGMAIGAGLVELVDLPVLLPTVGTMCLLTAAGLLRHRRQVGDPVPMGKVICDITISADGYSAGLNQTEERPFGDDGGDGTGGTLHAWMFDTPDENRAELDRMAAAKAFIMGRNMFGPVRGAWDRQWNGWWGDDPPFHAPVFVLTHHAREPQPMGGGTTFHFVTDGIESALAQARAAAGDGDVAVQGGATTVNQYLAAGLIDELRLHIVPLTLGTGTRLFEGVSPLELEQVTSRPARRVTHVTYRVLS